MFDHRRFLRPDSRCIDKASCASAPDFDVDGQLRPQGAGMDCDVGADEVY